jgi:hypothetical protein
MIMSRTTDLSIGRPFFDYNDGVHTILISLEPGTQVVRYELYEGQKGKFDSFRKIHQGGIFELTRYLLKIDLTEFADEGDKLYEICVFDDKNDFDFTDIFVFNEKANKFEVYEGYYKQGFYDINRQYFRIALGGIAIGCIIYCLL